MQSHRWKSLVSVFTLVVMLLGFVQPSVAEFTPQSAGLESDEPGLLQPVIVRSTKNDLSPALRDMQSAQPVNSDDGLEIPQFSLPKTDRTAPGAARDEAIIQSAPLGPNAMPAPLQSFEGLGNLFGGWPPDTQGEIGPNHYVQWNNVHFAIWQIDKVANTATLVYGPVTGNTLFSGFGGPCETTNDGDPITLYDQFADRWLMTQFALPNYPSGPFYECLAVSQTSDPTGAWHRYAFQMPVNKMNDYPKFGVWPDAYYMTVNQFNANNLTWGGAGVAALDRAAMVTGSPASMVYFDLYSVNPNYGGMLPADFDGLAAPPAGNPGIFAEWDDSTWIGPSDSVRIWEFNVDWATPANSTFGVGGNPNYTIPTANVDPDMCGYARDCVPQPGTSVGLDAISDRLMHRLQYRNFGDYETLVTNHTVDASGTDHAGVHWFELRDTGGGWSMYQEGVYAPDSDNRWMGSAAMDQVGNIGLGYSVSSSSTYPSVVYTGRLANDPLGTLPQGEQSLVVGTGSQTGANRWGDYSMMGVDPDDDCTFWYTQEYVEVTGSNTWKTRIGSFRFPNCTLGPLGTLEGTVTDSVSAGPIPGAAISATLSPTQTFGTVTNPSGFYSFDLPAGTYEVTASAFGYQADTITGVVVIQDTTTTQDFNLVPGSEFTVSGEATDATTGWPLYAKITIGGAPIDPLWSEPLTGAYTVTLPAGIAYNFHVEAFTPGYLPLDRTVGPLTGDQTEDFALQADLVTCDAPGYALDPSNNCLPQPGGLVVGNVYDANTSLSLNAVSVENQDVYSTTTVPTPDDPSVDDGYFTLFSPAGLKSFQAIKNGYTPDHAAVDVVGGAIIRQDFYLEAGWLQTVPDSIAVTVDMGATTSAPLSLDNLGGVGVDFEIKESDQGVQTTTPGLGAPVRRITGSFTPDWQGATSLKDIGVERPVPRLAPPWMSIADYPSAIMDNSASYLDGKVYSVGGYDGLSTLDASYVYDPVGDSWSPITDMTYPRQKPAVAFLDGLLYVVGGWDAGGIPVAALEIYNPLSNSWSAGTPVPTAYAAATMVSLDGNLYVIGGCNSGSCGFTDVYRYDPVADSWTAVAAYPEPVSWEACGVLDGQIYCAGGVSDLGEIDRTYVYNQVADSWSPLATMPQAQWAAGFTSHDGKLYISGGVTNNFSTVTNETFVYDPVTNAWSPEANSNNTVYRGASACGFYKIGGSTGGFSPMPNSEIYPGLNECGLEFDVPWLSEDPISGTLAGGGASIITAPDFNPPSTNRSLPGARPEGLVSMQAGGSNAAAPQPSAPTAILWDQPSAGGTAIIDQYFPDYLAGVYSADDFTVDSTWAVTDIFIDGNSNSLVNAEALYWVIYPDAGGVPAGYPGDGSSAEVWSFASTPAGAGVTISGGINDDVTLDIVAATGAPLYLAPGTYWLSVFPSLNFTSFGQWFWDVAATSNGAVADVVDPVNLLGAGWTSWTAWTDINAVAHDGAFRLDGDLVDPSQMIDLTFDAGVPEVTQPGDYYASLRVLNDTPYGTVSVPVTMTVNAPSSWGKLEGTVTGLGHCDDDPSALVEADVVIQGGLDTYTVTTDVDGYYSWWMDQANGPVEVRVTFPDYEAGTATGVTISAGSTTRQDFGLRWLQPCVDATPEALHVSVAQGYSAILPVTLANDGAAASSFEIFELSRVPLPRRVIAEAGWAAVNARSAPNTTGLATPARPGIPVDILLDEGFEGGVMPPVAWTQVISNTAYTWVIDPSAHSGVYGAKVPWNYSHDEWLLSPELILSEATLSFWSMGSIYWCRDDFDNCDLNVWIVVGDAGGGDDILVGRAEDDWPDNWTWTESFFDLTPYLPGGPVRVGFQLIGDDDADVHLDDILLDGFESADIPWLSEDPISGTLSADSFLDVDVTFDANVPEITGPGDYLATLIVRSDDPVKDRISIPVTMTVVPVEYGVDIGPDGTMLGAAGTTVNYTLMVTNTSNGPVDSFDLSVSGNTWTTNAPATVGPLAMGESTSVPVSVDIPASALGGTLDVATVTAASQADPTKTSTATLTTRGVWYQLYLPNIYKVFTP